MQGQFTYNAHTNTSQSKDRHCKYDAHTMQGQFTYNVHTNTPQSQCQYYLHTNLHDLLAMGWPFFPFFCALFSSSSLLTLDAALFFSSILFYSVALHHTLILFSTSHQTKIYHMLLNRASSHNPNLNSGQSVIVCKLLLA